MHAGTHVTHGAAATKKLAAQLAAALAPGTLVLFTGGMGAGKTTFCAGLAEGLGCTDAAASPTFSIVNVYRGPRPLAHFDLYRIACPEDLETAGLFDYLAEGAIVAVEWSELAAGRNPCMWTSAGAKRRTSESSPSRRPGYDGAWAGLCRKNRWRGRLPG